MASHISISTLRTSPADLQHERRTWPGLVGQNLEVARRCPTLRFGGTKRRLVRLMPALFLLLAGLPMVLWPTQAATLEDSLDAPGLLWTTGGDAAWSGQSTVTHDGVDAAQCGALTNANTQSWLQTTVTGRVTVLFWWKSVSPIPS